MIEDKVVSRTATFVFMIGKTHFGTLTAFVKGDAAANYKFTSALPVQVLKALAPTLQPLFAEERDDPTAVRDAAGTVSNVPQP